MFHDLTTYRRQGNRSIVGRLRAVPFLEDWRDVSASPIIRQTACFKRTSKDGSKRRCDFCTPILEYGMVCRLVQSLWSRPGSLRAFPHRQSRCQCQAWVGT